MSEKNTELRDKLLNKSKPLSEICTAETVAAANAFCEPYKAFLDAAKTERESVVAAVALAKEAGFIEYERGKNYPAGTKVYSINRGKALLLAVIGTQPCEKGVHISAAHIDSPRLDLKPNPLVENDDLCYLKTHYYGGIKKYQWTTVPLSLHGVVCLKDGSTVTVCIGEDDSDPQLCITDLLIHLSADQMRKTASEVISGENLSLLVGSLPLEGDDGANSVKLNVMRLLNEKYGITEHDFLSAELEAVPALKARDIGLDRSLIGAYGHDDRVCAYPSLRALMDIGTPVRTCVVCLADKEEIGSMGNTGLASCFLENFVRDLTEAQGGCGRAALSASDCLSADVNAALDPLYPEVHERNNAARINRGVVLTKYTGSRGKGGSSDASAEFMAKCRRIFDGADVLWQTGELGRVDQGGGGTVALYVAQLDVDVVDVGVPVLSMHAPYEIVSKLDVYMTYKAIKAYFED